MWTNLLLWTIFVLIIVPLILFYWKYFEFERHLSNIKGITVLPLIGNAYLCLGKDTEQILAIIHNYAIKFKLMKFWFGPHFYIGVADPEACQKIFSSPFCLQRPANLNFVRMDNGLISAPYHIWKGNRKSLNTTFSTTVLTSFIPIFKYYNEKLVEKFRTLDGCGEVDVQEHFARCTLNMVTATLLGVKATEHTPDCGERHPVDVLFEIATERMFNIFLQPEFIYRFTKYYKIEMKYQKICSDFIDSVIQSKRKQLEEKRSFSDDEDKRFRKAQIFLDLLLQMSEQGRHFTDLEIRQNVSAVTVAGFDTTAMTISYTVLMLAMHPEVQERVFREISVLFEGEEYDFSGDALKEMEYSERCLKEVMRLFPAVPITVREALDNIDLGICTVPKGANFLVSLYSLHRRPDVWGPEPHHFDPDNFLPERVANRHPFAYIPFSHGARNCFGKQYAWLSLKVMLVYLVKNFKFSTSLNIDELRFKFEISQKLIQKHMVAIEKRK